MNPKTNLEFISIREFRPQFMIFLQPNPYSTSAFFQSLSNSWVGHDLVDTLLKELAKVKGYPAQWEILSKYPSMELHFKKFAEDVTTGKISDPGGGFLPKISLVSSFSVDISKSPKTYDVQFRPFSIISTTFSFPKGGLFRLTWPEMDLDHDSISVSTREAGTHSSWEDVYAGFPKVIDTSCNGQNSKQEFLVISTVPTDKLKTAQVEVSYEDSPCLCEERLPFDSCLQGKWELDNASVFNMFKRIFSPSQMEVMDVSGQAFAHFFPAKKMEMSYQNYKISIKKDDFFNDKQMILEVIMNGTSKANLGIPEKNNLCYRDIETAAEVTTTLIVDGHSSSTESPIRDFVEKGIHTYQCGPDRLVLFRKLPLEEGEEEVPLLFHKR